MNSTEIKVSVIMPSLNVVDYIDECVCSVLNQTLSDIEIIFVDAGSTDGTYEKLKKYSEDNEDKVKLICSDVKSYGYQVNLGISEAIGEYIAIVETDDYIDCCMYEELYNSAIKNKADVAKGDFDSFITYDSDNREYTRVKMWQSNSDCYNVVLDPRYNLDIYKRDHNIWKGIYRKSFLIQNDIKLNESKGAAFQDIGFTHQVLASCERIVYVDASYYRYRMDRDFSSINSAHGLEYSYNEFRRLIENDVLSKKIVYFQGLYAHMSQSFITELTKALRNVEYNYKSRYIWDYYDWFKQTIEAAISENIFVPSNDEKVLHVINDIDAYVDELKKNDDKLKKWENNYLSSVQGKKVVIFGAGIRGKDILHLFLKNSVNVIAVTDNNSSLWGTKMCGICICPPNECIRQDDSIVYAVANKKHSEDITNQLINMGVSLDQIAIFEK